MGKQILKLLFTVLFIVFIGFNIVLAENTKGAPPATMYVKIKGVENYVGSNFQVKLSEKWGGFFYITISESQNQILISLTHTFDKFLIIENAKIESRGQNLIDFAGCVSFEDGDSFFAIQGTAKRNKYDGGAHSAKGTFIQSNCFILHDVYTTSSGVFSSGKFTAKR